MPRPCQTFPFLPHGATREQFAYPSHFYGPNTPYENWVAWNYNLSVWKQRVLSQSSFDDALYVSGNTQGDELNWIHSAYVAPQMHPFDRFFYTPSETLENGTYIPGKYTVQKWLDSVNTKYGKVDAILLWPTYPNIGVDDRSQFDWFESLPLGGVRGGLKDAIKELHSHGVKVLVPYNPWDTGTRRLPNNQSDAEGMADLCYRCGADGFNGDTMVEIPQNFYTTAKEKYNLSLALMPELGATVESMNWTVMNWGYWEYPSPDEPPCVDTLKYLNPKRMTQVCDRWAKTKTDDVQNAFINGDGYVPWENVWGTWNGIDPRGAALIERQAEILRFFQGKEEANILTNAAWSPLYPCHSGGKGCYTSRWRNQTTTRAGGAFTDDTFLFFFINRGPTDHTQVAVQIGRDPHMAEGGKGGDAAAAGTTTNGDVKVETNSSSVGRRCAFDCYHGTNATISGDGAEAYTSLPPWGIGCLIVLPADQCGHSNDPRTITKAEMKKILVNQREMGKKEQNNHKNDEFSDMLEVWLVNTIRPLTAVPLDSMDNQWVFLQQGAIPVIPSKVKVPLGSHDPPAGMKPIEGNPAYLFNATGVEIEGPPDSGVDFQFFWETHPQRHHSKVLNQSGFWMDTHLVTNQQWLDYIRASGYTAHDTTNYLRFWQQYGSGTSSTSGDSKFTTAGAANQTTWRFKVGTEKQPVTWISPREAQGYCRFLNKRLPRATEWQYAGQGADPTRLYPWGNSLNGSGTNTSLLMPNPTTGNDMPLPSDVDAFPQSASPFGIEAMVGLVWQWTDTFEDLHTRTNLMKGGSYYRPSGSQWYLPHALQLNEHQKFLLMDDSYDRAGAVGFRCVMDV